MRSNDCDNEIRLKRYPDLSSMGLIIIISGDSIIHLYFGRIYILIPKKKKRKGT